MAFISLVVRNTGDPVYSSDYQKIKDNFDDLDSRTSANEAAISKVSMYEGTFYGLSNFSTLTGFDPKMVTQDFTATAAVITIFIVGSLTGTFEIDVKKIPGTLDPSGAVSIFTTKPSINLATAVDYQKSTNGVFDVTTKDFEAGDYFYFDITQMPTGGSIGKVVLAIYGEI